MVLSASSRGYRMVHGLAKPTATPTKTTSSPSPPPLRRSTTRCSTSITSTKATTTSSPGAARWAMCAWASMGLGEASSWFDSNVVDGAVNAAGWITRFTATILQLVGQVDHRRHRRQRPRDPGAHAKLSRAPLRMGPGAMVCPGHDRRLGRFRVLLRVPLKTATSC